MNKLKETTTALRTHLGRDERGHELLAQVERIANDQRKELAAEKERSARLEQVAKDLRQQLDAKDATITAAVRRAELADANRKQAERERDELAAGLSKAWDDIAKLQPELEPYQLTARELAAKELAEKRQSLQTRLGVRSDIDCYVDPKLLTDEFNILRREMRVPPLPLDPRAVSRHPSFYFSLDSLIGDFSYNSLQTLGRFVALQALFNFPCMVVTDYTVLVDESNAQSLEPFMSWLMCDPRKLSTSDCLRLAMLGVGRKS